ncbi:hypothetical protein E6C60_2611 [Paenibacillus algicola]|uniref:Uncharacterized protein n=1 Tax=Paenibacillus algicola TaxID=2565926 RepID=A0A4P8XLM7_9BACL|nr:hypothetical protein [Paenibacillus algicola]QCT03323.1 hypothetical protein E6C60_2611 [Paenibacillus algicola]
MINGEKVQQIQFSSNELCVVENEMNVLLVYPENGLLSLLKLENQADILALRNMLNRAYPEDKPVYERR